jgi:CheY-like chemotaxis protein
VRAFIRQTLEEEGYQLNEATDGEEGLKALHTFPADLVITDIFMPYKEGIETIHELHRAFPQIKLLAISGGGTRMMTEALPAARQFGAHHTLAKPFTPEELLDAVTTALPD